MAETFLQLRLSRAQLEQFTAHLFTSVYCQALQALEKTPPPTLEIVKELGSRCVALCALSETEFSLALSAEEVGVLQDLFAVLQLQYAQSSLSEQRSLALEHLSACRLLLEQAIRSKEEYLSVREAARLMGVSSRTIYGYLEAGRLQGVRKRTTTVLAAQDVQQYQRAAIGRPRTRVPIWRKPVPTNLEYLTTIAVRMRKGQSEQLAQRLSEIRSSRKHLISGTVARYVVRENSDPERIQIVLVWRKLVMPPEEERQAAIAALCTDLSDLLDWETATCHEGQVLLNT